MAGKPDSDRPPALLLVSARLNFVEHRLEMSVMDEREREQHRPDLKILFVTGYAEHAIKGNFLEPGMAMVTKPFALDALALKIRDMLSPRQR